MYSLKFSWIDGERRWDPETQGFQKRTVKELRDHKATLGGKGGWDLHHLHAHFL